MVATSIWLPPNTLIHVGGRDGINPTHGSFSLGEMELGGEDFSRVGLTPVMAVASLCNTSNISPPILPGGEEEWNAVGDPTEIALAVGTSPLPPNLV